MGTVDLLDGWVDLDRRVVHREGREEALTGREAALLAVLTRHAGTDCPRGLLLQEAWQLRPDTATRAIDATVRRLRRKLEPRPGTPQLLLTVHGVGYRWAPTPDVTATPDAGRRVLPPLAHVPTDDLPLIGRSADLATLLGTLEPRARVALVGPGGVGKSALSREVARQWSVTQARPAFWVPMEGIARLDDASWRLVDSLGVAARRDPRAALARALARLGSALLVLDGVDALPDDDLATLVEGVEAPVLLTARARRDDALSQRVGPLSAADGVALLRARIGLLGLRPPPDEALAAVVRSVDGLPLALALAVPRLRVLTPEQLVARTSSLPAPARIQAWWGDLPPATRASLSDLSVLPERFGLSLAQAVVGPEVVTVLADLCDRSWLQTHDDAGERTFAWLALLRHQARTALDAEDDVQQRIAAHLGRESKRRLDLRFGPGSAEDARWLRRHRTALEASAPWAPPEHQQAVWAAVRFARQALGDGDGVDAAAAHIPGPLGAFHRGDPLPPSAPPLLKACAELARAIEGGMLPAAQPAAEQVCAGAGAEDPRAYLEGCRVRSYIEATRGDWEAAAAARRQGIRALGPIYASAPLRLAPFPLPLADQLTIDDIDHILDDARVAGDRQLEVKALANGATCALEQQHVTLATQWAEAAYGVLWSIDLAEVRAGAYGNIGLIFRELAAHRRAQSCLEQAWRDAPPGNLAQYRSLAGLGLATTWIDAGQLGQARAMLDEVAALTEQPRLQLRVGQFRTVADALDGQDVRAELRKLLQQSEALHSSSDVGRCALWLAACGAPDADDLLRQAEAAFAPTGESELFAIHELMGRRGVREVAEPDVDPGHFSSMVRLVRRLAGAQNPAR